jgi:alpha-tubulin suppressor-like RCC1 family protein
MAINSSSFGSYFRFALGAAVVAAVGAFSFASCSVDTSGLVFDDGLWAEAGLGDDGGLGGTSGDGGDGGANTPCTAGEVRCTADGFLQTCEGDPGVYNAGTNCGGPGRCSASRNMCLDCAPGSTRCAGPLLEQCTMAGDGYEPVMNCSSGENCVAGELGYCRDCAAGDMFCEAHIVLIGGAGENQLPQQRLIACAEDDQGHFTRNAACEATSPICNADAKACRACEAGTSSCYGPRVERCNADGTSSSVVRECTFSSMCDAETQTCSTPTCAANQTQCDGARLQGCADGSWIDLKTCGSADLCDINQGCRVCQPYKQRCNGKTLESCNAYGTAWITKATCGSALTCFVDSNGYGYCNTCEPGSWECWPGDTYYGVCGQLGYYEYNGTQCATGTVCDAKLKKCVTCTPGVQECTSSNQLRRCRDDGTGWDVVENCQVNRKQCIATLPQCADGSIGSTFCDEQGNFKRVGADGVAVTVQACGSPALCDYVAGCLPPKCTVGQILCQGGRALRCGDGANMTEIADCGSPNACVDGLGCVTALAVGAGTSHTCAVLTPRGVEAPLADRAGVIACWGANDSGQLGTDGPLVDASEPRLMVVKPVGFDDMPAGWSIAFFRKVCGGKDYSCAEYVFAENNTPKISVACWGSNQFGQLGIGSEQPGPYNSLVALIGGDSPETSLPLRGLTCGEQFACAQSSLGVAHCWGANADGQIGNGAKDPAGVRAPYAVGTHRFTHLSAGARHVCGVKGDGTVWCWGANDKGQLGTGGPAGGSATPVKLDLTGAKAAAPVAGSQFTGLLVGTSGGRSFGDNLFGQLLTANTQSSTTPVSMAGLGTVAPAQWVSGPGASHACLRTAEDSLRCWGANVFGQLGVAGTLDQSSLAPVVGIGSLQKQDAIAVGGAHTCAIDETGGLHCWGANSRGQLGLAKRSVRELEPRLVIPGAAP